MEKSKIVYIISVFLISLIPIFFGSLLFVSPFFGDINLIDEGQFLAWANHMFHGKLMYKDIYITYGPLYVYPVFLIVKFVEDSVFAFRFYSIALNGVLGILSVSLLLRRINLSLFSKITILLLITLIPGITIRLVPAILAIFFITGRRSSLNNFLLGVVSAMSLLISQEIGVFVGMISMMSIFFGVIQEKRIREIIFRIVNFFVGFFIISSLFFVWSSYEGWFESYLLVSRDVLTSFSGINLPNGKAFPNLISNFTSITSFQGMLRAAVSKDILMYSTILLYIITFFFLVYKFAVREFLSQHMTITYINILGIFLFALIIGRAGNFFLMYTPAIIILVFFAENIIRSLDFKRRIELAHLIIIFILICLFIIRTFVIFRPHFYQLPTSIKAVYATYETSARVGNINISDGQTAYIEMLQDYIAKNTNDNDYIFFWSNEPMIYFLSDRQNPTAYDLPYIANTIEKRFEIVASLKESRPKFIFYNTRSWAVDEVDNKKRLPEVTSYVNLNYKKCDIIGNVEIYCRAMK